MNYKHILLFFMAVFNLLFCKAQDKDKGINNTGKSLLWRISGNEMTEPSYLFGTIHLICKEDYLWTDVMQEKLMAADEVCFEMDLDDPALVGQVATGLIDPSGKTLKEQLTQEQYLILEKYIADSLGMNIAMFQQLKPAALHTLFATKAVNCATPESYESNIMELAAKEKKEITGLETAAEQLALFDTMPTDSVIADLIDMAKDNSEERAVYRKMVQAYKNQDLNALNRLIRESQTSSDDYAAFLDDRNEKWIERMTEKMDQNSVFFAVGAGHLWGDKGLITLLRKAGYTVEAIK